MKKKKTYQEPSVSQLLVEAENSILLCASYTTQQIGVLQVGVEEFVYDGDFAPENEGGYGVTIYE